MYCHANKSVLVGCIVALFCVASSEASLRKRTKFALGNANDQSDQHRSLKQDADLFDLHHSSHHQNVIQRSIPDGPGDRVYFDPSEVPHDERIRSKAGDARVVGGSDSPVEPWFALLLQTSSTGGFSSGGCGASLVSNCFVLTAAHCVKNSRANAIGAVYVSAHQPYSGNDNVPYHLSKVRNTISHSGYLSSTNQNDVALLRMEECLDDSKFRPVTLARPGVTPQKGDIMNVFGFGRLAEDNTNRVRTLQTARVPFIPTSSCKSTYQPDGLTVYNDMVCAGYENGGIDSCRGDSGGPLVKLTQGDAIQYGVVSWGVGCGRKNKPGVYASVAQHFNWIRSHVCSDPDTNRASFICFGYNNNNNFPAPAVSPTRRPTPRPTRRPTPRPTPYPTRRNPVVDLSSFPRPQSAPRPAPAPQSPFWWLQLLGRPAAPPTQRPRPSFCSNQNTDFVISMSVFQSRFGRSEDTDKDDAITTTTTTSSTTTTTPGPAKKKATKKKAAKKKAAKKKAIKKRAAKKANASGRLRRELQLVSLRFSCAKMAPGERGHAYCGERDMNTGILGTHHCRASCHPSCL